MLETALRTYIEAQTSITTLVSTRVYPVILPQTPVYPAITYNKVAAPRDSDLAGPNGIVRARISINCWALTYLAAKTLSETVRAALNGHSGTFGTGGSAVTVDRVLLENEIDLYEEAAKVHHIVTDYLITHRE